MTAQAKKAAAKKTAVKKTTAKKTAVKKTAAKKTAVKKTTAKKAPARKTTAKKTAAKKPAAVKAPAGQPAPASPPPAGEQIEAAAPPVEEQIEAAAPPVEESGAPAVLPVEEQIEAMPEMTAPVADGAWNPSIVVFACNWCSYAGADTAGVSRIQHQPHFRTIRVMCSGRVHPGFVMRAFEKGADGVLVSGCHIGDCHYVSGNERQIEIFEITKQLVHLIGLEPGRVRLEWVSAAEGPRWAALINEFTDQIRRLGPSPLRDRSPAAG